MKNKSCSICKKKFLRIIDLGNHPCADTFVKNQNLAKNLKKYPLDPSLESKTLLTKWLIDIHNEVNKKNGKRIYSYEEVEKIYKDMYSMKNNNNIIVNNEINWNTILIIIVIILIGYFLYKEYS